MLAMKSNIINGFLLDSYIAGGNQERFQEFRLERIIEQITSSGVLFLNDGIKFAPCVRDQLSSHQGEVFEWLTKSIKPIKVYTITEFFQKPEPENVFLTSN